MTKLRVINFKDFWLANKSRYLKIADLDIKLALNIACEDAWEYGKDNNGKPVSGKASE